MFIGRTTELSKLNALYNSGKFECVVIYGRRRIGKTTLINEFTKSKPAILFTGLESNAKENLENLSKRIFAISPEFAHADASFQSFEKALGTVFDMAKDKRLILAIDEYPYLASSERSISSLLQGLIDRYHSDSKLFLILCGSSLSFMETQVLGYQSPIFGRRTAQFKIQPFTFFEACAYYRHFSPEELAVIYGITGGIPQYMAKIRDGASIEENIRDNFLDPSAYLFEEPTNLVKQECREPAQYNAIIRAIATGSSRLSEIASKVGLDTGLCSNYLSTLMSIGIVKKEYPFRENVTKKTIYALSDSMFRFWYRFVPDHMALIQNGQQDLVYRRIAPHIPSYMGSVYEEICKQWLWRENIAERLPVLFVDLGRWWGNDPKRRRETEIDIMAYGDDEHVLFAECKWTNEPIDVGILDDLIEDSELFRYPHKYLYLFSKTGFTPGCLEKAAQMNNVYPISFSNML